MPKEAAQLVTHIDTSMMALLPPGFFQRGLKFLRENPTSQFVLQPTQDRIYMRSFRAKENGHRPKDITNGRIITWCWAFHSKIFESPKS